MSVELASTAAQIAPALMIAAVVELAAIQRYIWSHRVEYRAKTSRFDATFGAKSIFGVLLMHAGILSGCGEVISLYRLAGQPFNFHFWFGFNDACIVVWAIIYSLGVICGIPTIVFFVVMDLGGNSRFQKELIEPFDIEE